jgi:hypothetical protein
MKLKQLKFFILSLILTSMASAQVVAQRNSTLFGNEKGNGGDIDSISRYGLEKDFSRVKFELVDFLVTEKAQDLFLHIDLKRTIKLLLEDNTFSIVKESLYDKYNSKKDALNFPENLKVLLRYGSLVEALGSKAAYVLVLHEVFGIQGVEKYSSSDPGSAYAKSIKIWDYIALSETYELKVQEEVTALKVCEIMESSSGLNSTQKNVIDCISGDYGQFEAKAMKVCETIISKSSLHSTQLKAIRCIDTIRDKTYKSSYVSLCLKIAKSSSLFSAQEQAINCLKSTAN